MVASYLKSHGYRIIPVNPAVREVLGEPSYPDLAAIPPEVAVDVVDVFRRPIDIPGHLDDLLAKKPRADQVFVEVRGALAARPDGFLVQLTTQSKEPPAGVFPDRPAIEPVEGLRAEDRLQGAERREALAVDEDVVAVVLLELGERRRRIERRLGPGPQALEVRVDEAAVPVQSFLVGREVPKFPPTPQAPPDSWDFFRLPNLYLIYYDEIHYMTVRRFLRGFLWTLLGQSTQSNSVGYSQFLADVQAGQVTQVVQQSDTLTVTKQDGSGLDLIEIRPGIGYSSIAAGASLPKMK